MPEKIGPARSFQRFLDIERKGARNPVAARWLGPVLDVLEHQCKEVLAVCADGVAAGQQVALPDKLGHIAARRARAVDDPHRFHKRSGLIHVGTDRAFGRLAPHLRPNA